MGTEPGKIDIDPFSTYERYVWRSETDPHDGTGINTQIEVDRLTAAVVASNSPLVQWGFQTDFVPRAEAAGWTIPAQWRGPLAEMAERADRAPIHADEIVGYVNVPLPFPLDVQALVENYFPNMQYRESPHGERRMMVDAQGNTVLEFYGLRKKTIVVTTPPTESETGQCFVGSQKFTVVTDPTVYAIASPLTHTALAEQLLWGPRIWQLNFTALLGLPTPSPAVVGNYISARYMWESTHFPHPPEMGAITNPAAAWYRPWFVDKVDWQQPKTIRDYVLSQRQPAGEQMWHGFAIAHGGADAVALHTDGARLALIIHDRHSDRTLLASFDPQNYEESWLNPRTFPDLACAYRAYADDSPSEAKTRQVLGVAHPEGVGAFFEWNILDDTRCAARTPPFEWTVATFRDAYFPTSSNQIEITVISTDWKVPLATETLVASVQEYFPDAIVRSLTVRAQMANLEVDATTGALTKIGERNCVEHWCSDYPDHTRFEEHLPEEPDVYATGEW